MRGVKGTAMSSEERKRTKALNYRRWRKENKEHLTEYLREWFDNQRRQIEDLKNKPCMDCGNLYPAYVMDFDHVRGKKLFNIGSTQGRLKIKWDKVLEEIAKCDLVCANCHRIRTYGRTDCGLV